jgi:hypothetical protein
MRARGLEPHGKGDSDAASEGVTQRSPQTLAAELWPADLREVIARWAKLPEPIRLAVVAVVRQGGA